jgi:hypothetical protein
VIEQRPGESKNNASNTNNDENSQAADKPFAEAVKQARGGQEPKAGAAE